MVAMVGVLATLAAPSFNVMIARQKLRTASTAVSESLWLARSEAQKRNTPVGFSFSSVGDGWDVKVITPDTVLSHRDAVPSVTSGAANFVFNGYGRLTGSVNLELVVASANQYRCVRVSTTGLATELDGQC